MDDVTDTVFRRMVAETAPADVYFTEFINVDALQSQGREAAMRRLRYSDGERPIIAQLWGLKPENFYKSAQDVVALGYDGIDLNFGCPEKNVVKAGACSALINDRELAAQIIKATREGAGSLPLSVKTRLGWNEVDLTWHDFLLQQKLDALTIHGRTRSQMSKAPADWKMIAAVAHLRNTISPATKIIGNGDVMSRAQGEQLAEACGLDGIMIGRGVFHDPYVFASDSPWEDCSRSEKIDLYRRHVELFAQTWQPGERNVHILNKFCKVYINGFDGAKELREQLMAANSTDELLELLHA